jgi:lysophospholipase L1-like esterase
MPTSSKNHLFFQVVFFLPTLQSYDLVLSFITGGVIMTKNMYRKRTAYDREKENKRKNFIHLNQNYCKPNQTVIAGDSITEIFNMDLFESYIEKSGKSVYNRGISGDTSDRFLERFDDTVLSLKPSNLVLLIGTNDLSLINDIDYIYGNIEQIIAKSKTVCNNIILQSVYPVDSKNKSKNKNIIALNSKLKALCERENIAYLDLYPSLLDSNGGFNSKYTYDGLHPNVLGFEIVAQQIIPLLK